MNLLLLYLVSLILLFFQLSGLDYIYIFDFKIGFSYITTLTIMFSFKSKNIYKVILFCVSIGLLIDIYNSNTSFYFFSFGIMSILVNIISKKINASSFYLFLIISFFTFFVEIINATLIGFFYYKIEHDLISYQVFRDNIISYIIGNNIIGYIFYLFFRNIKEKN